MYLPKFACSLVLCSLLFSSFLLKNLGFPGVTKVKSPPAEARDTGDMGSVSGWGRSPRGGNGNPLQYSCLGNPMDRGPWRLQSMESQRVRNNWAWTHIWRTSFSISFGWVSWWGILLFFMYLKMSLFHFHFWKIFSLDIKFWVDRIFPLCFKDVVPLFPGLHSFWWKVSFIHTYTHKTLLLSMKYVKEGGALKNWCFQTVVLE